MVEQQQRPLPSNKHANILPHDEHRTVLGLRLSALAEMVIFFAIVLLLNLFFGSPRFIEATPHPFWILVVLISVQYGSNEGLVSVLLSTLVLLVGNIPEQQFNEDYYSWLYDLAFRPIVWLVTAVVLGEIARRHLRARKELADSLRESIKREEKFALSYETVRERKDRLELNIAGQVRTETSAYHAAKAMEKLNPEQVVDGIATMISNALGAQKFSIYLLEDDMLQRRLTRGWSDGDEAQYDAQYRPHTQLYQSVVARHETLSVINEDHERLLAGHGIMAGAMRDSETGTIVGMIKIEDIAFLDLSLHTVQTFDALCEWSAMALLNARNFQIALDESTVNPEHNLMTRSFFARYRDYITALAQRVKFNVFMLNVNVSNFESLDADDRVKAARIISDSVSATLRTVDFAFDHQQNSSHYAIILPATDESGARIVKEKIERALQANAARSLRQARFSFSLDALHEV